MKKYEWAVIGSGIAGISIAEILSRQGHSVVLIEKNKTLASETTREFHEWLHTGALYTLVPDRLKTLRFTLGAIDDLIEYYSCFDNMNLTPTVSGLDIYDSNKKWFDDNYIHFKYKVRGRKITFPWLLGIARSIQLIEKIHQHDWLRRRAGELKPFLDGRSKRIIDLLTKLILHKDEFLTVRTPDISINSRVLLNDLLSTAIDNGLDISINNELKQFEKKGENKILHCKKENFIADKVVLCNSIGIKNFSDTKIKTTYAPIAVVSGISKNAKSFVELDYFPKKCINMLTKDDNFALVGGISLRDKSKCDDYLDYVVKRHKILEPNLKEHSRYIGLKNEITFKNQPRGYLYHIKETDKNVWGVIPGKFSLAFSLAPEFYRRIYYKNPKKIFNTTIKEKNKKLSNTVWMDTILQEKEY